MSDQEWARLVEIIGYPGREFTLWSVDGLVRFAGAQRAGARVVERIEQQLAANDIGHLPAKLPTDGGCQVLLYRKDSAGAANLIVSLTQTLATQDVDDNTNALIHQLHTSMVALTSSLQGLDRGRRARSGV